MNATKSLFLALLLSVPSFAQTPTPTPHVSVSDIEDCANYAINYSLLVYVAHYSKSEEEFKKFVEDQVSRQQSPNLGAIIRRFGEEAWLERNSPPSMAAMDVFRQCEASLIDQAPNEPEQPKIQTKFQSWDQENLKRNDHGCPTAVFIAPNGDLQQCVD